MYERDVVLVAKIDGYKKSFVRGARKWLLMSTCPYCNSSSRTLEMDANTLRWRCDGCGRDGVGEVSPEEAVVMLQPLLRDW